MPYFCTHLELVCVIDGANNSNGKWKYRRDNQFYILKTSDNDNALELAREIGRQKELTYENSERETVNWIFKGVRQIWQLPENLNGIEVASMRDWLQTDDAIDIEYVSDHMVTMYSDERHQDNRNAG